MISTFYPLNQIPLEEQFFDSIYVPCRHVALLLAALSTDISYSLSGTSMVQVNGVTEGAQGCFGAMTPLVTKEKAALTVRDSAAIIESPPSSAMPLFSIGWIPS